MLFKKIVSKSEIHAKLRRHRTILMVMVLNQFPLSLFCVSIVAVQFYLKYVHPRFELLLLMQFYILDKAVMNSVHMNAQFAV